MERIKVQDAVGQVLCHDVTRIVKGDEAAGTAEFKEAQFHKGHIIREEDIPPTPTPPWSTAWAC